LLKISERVALLKSTVPLYVTGITAKFKSIRSNLPVRKAKEVQLHRPQAMMRTPVTTRSQPSRAYNGIQTSAVQRKSASQSELSKNRGLKAIFTVDFLKTKKFQFLILPLFIILFVGAYGYHWYFYSIGSYFTATVKYKYIPISETRTITATADANAESIKTVKLPSEESTSTFVPATGEKPTGERAKGSVSIFNPTTDIKIIKAGTALSCTSNACMSLNYVTDSDLNLGPGSSEDVTVTAADIGENYNLSPGAGRFKVGSFNPATEVLASNVKPIAGGTPKKIVKVVKAEDIKKAEESAMADLKNRLVDKIKNDPANLSSFVIAESSIVIEKISSEPDLKEGQEGDIVNVTVRAKGTVDAFAKDQIDVVVNKMKTEVTPDGYYLDEKFTNNSFKIVGQSAGKIDVAVTLNSTARPDIDLNEVKKSLGGKSYSESDRILGSIPHTTGYTKNYEPKSLPEFFWKIPNSANRVQIKLIAEGPEQAGN
jgi:hypothetical protein